jgi:hypothetical protein
MRELAYFRTVLLLPILIAGVACAGSSGSSESSGTTSNTSAPAGSLAAGVNSNVLDKTYDRVVFATTHNAYNYTGAFRFPNQNKSITDQLQDGVRGFMIDIHPYGGFDPALNGVPHVYHNIWTLGAQSLAKVLDEFQVFMDANPEAIVTLILENYISFPILDTALNDAGLLRFAHSQKKGDSWPTIRTMIANNKRLVILNDAQDSTGAYPWSLYAWDFAVETDFSNQTVSDFSNSFNRGDPNNELFILNHFLTMPIIGTGDTSLAKTANSNPYLSQRVNGAFTDTSKIPNFITVDFHEIGDVMTVVKEMNDLIK